MTARKTTAKPKTRTVKAGDVRVGDRIEVRGMPGVVLSADPAAEEYPDTVEIWWRADIDDEENRRCITPFADEDVPLLRRPEPKGDDDDAGLD